MAKWMKAVLLTGLGISSVAVSQSNRELADGAANVLGINREGFCSSCHSLNSEGTINRWAASTSKVETCLQGTGSAKAKLSCISGNSAETTFDPAASDLGIYAAGLHLPVMTNLLKEAYGETKGAQLSSTLSRSIGMPMGTNARLSEAQFQAVQKWFQSGTPELDYLLGNGTVDESVCKPEYTPALAAHLKSQHNQSWKSHHELQGTPMFACPTNGEACFSQTRSGKEIFPDVTTSSDSRTWKLDDRSSMRKVTTFEGRRQYWIRSSVDGRFVGVGGQPSSMVDLQSLLAATPRKRVISVNAQYDPTFFPDDSSFVFQSNSTGFCNMSILKNSATTNITFREAPCQILSEKVPLYQSIGAALNGDDYLALTSSYQRDSGLDGTLAEFLPSENLMASANNKVSLYPLAFDGETWRRGAAQTFAVPFEIDWVLSHSNQLAMSRLQAKRDNVVRTKGFKLYKFSKQSAASKYEKAELATICGEGLKGDFSYDERYYVTYSYIRADQWKYFGYSSEKDPAFQAKLKAGAADLFLHDLYTQESFALTNMGPDQYALFPHFRADGWIYFEVYDRNSGVRTLVVSDTAVRRSTEVPFAE